MVNKDEFTKGLLNEFDCTSEERKKVVKQAARLASSGIYESSGGAAEEFTIDDAISSMKVAPDHLPITSKWNYWMGLLDTGDDGFSQFKC